jgi:DNA-nicking Smr family endonuclease
MYRKLTSTVGN